MKKIFALLFCLSLLVSGTAFAQQAKGAKNSKTPEEKAAVITKHLAKSLNLTADQSGKLEPINLKYVQAADALRAKFAADKKGLKPEMKTLNASHENELKAVLTAEQFSKYLAQKEEKARARQEKMAAKQKF